MLLLTELFSICICLTRRAISPPNSPSLLLLWSWKGAFIVIVYKGLEGQGIWTFIKSVSALSLYTGGLCWGMSASLTASFSHWCSLSSPPMWSSPWKSWWQKGDVNRDHRAQKKCNKVCNSNVKKFSLCRMTQTKQFHWAISSIHTHQNLIK